MLKKLRPLICFRVRADKEIILSAGAVNSPQILMLSGVGPKTELEKHKIPVIKELKVGHNLQDHVGLGGLTFLINKEDSITLDRIYSVGKQSLLIGYLVYKRIFPFCWNVSLVQFCVLWATTGRVIFFWSMHDV